MVKYLFATSCGSQVRDMLGRTPFNWHPHSSRLQTSSSSVDVPLVFSPPVRDNRCRPQKLTKTGDAYKGDGGQEDEEAPCLSSPSSLTSSFHDNQSGPEITGTGGSGRSAFAMETGESSSGHNSDHHSSAEERARAAFTNSQFDPHHLGQHPLSYADFARGGGGGQGDAGETAGSHDNAASSVAIFGSPNRMWAEDIATALVKATASAFPPPPQYYDGGAAREPVGDGRVDIGRWKRGGDDENQFDATAGKNSDREDDGRGSAALPPKMVFGAGVPEGLARDNAAASLHGGIMLTSTDFEQRQEQQDQQQGDAAFGVEGVSPGCSTGRTNTTIAVPNPGFGVGRGAEGAGGISPTHTPITTGKYSASKSPSAPPLKPPLPPVRSRIGSPASPPRLRGSRLRVLSNSNSGMGGVFSSSPGDIPATYSAERSKSREGRFGSWDASSRGTGREGRFGEWEDLGELG